MKVRDSGMPDELMWQQFFDASLILKTFGINNNVNDLAEFGCGYGTFTITAARCVRGVVYAFDIETDLVRMVRNKSHVLGLKNIRAVERDFVCLGTGLSNGSVDAALLFNVLHHEEPVALMAEAWRILRPGGLLAVIHWNHDPTTPRGPGLEIRPRPEQCIVWGETAGFSYNEHNLFDFPPYHYGLKFIKAKETENND